VDLEPVMETQDIQLVRDLVTRHAELTGSSRARMILDNWFEMLPRFIKVFPHEFKRVLGVSRARHQYIAGQPLPPVELAEQVQHG
jgi:glutamate synthase domain-containing protein 3